MNEVGISSDTKRKIKRCAATVHLFIFRCRCVPVCMVLRAGLLFVVCRKHFIVCRRSASWKDRAGRWSMFL